VAAIAAEFGFARWEDLMPYGVGAFVMFGLGSAPAGRLGDLWGRRRMMLLFFFGIGASSLLASLAQNAWQLAAALTLLGAFSAIYHPVGIPMLLQHSPRPGRTIGWSGLSGNLGIAVAAGLTGCWCRGRLALGLRRARGADAGPGAAVHEVGARRDRAAGPTHDQGRGTAARGHAGARLRGHDGRRHRLGRALQLHHQRQRPA
jgi:MFS family permease